MLCKEMIGEFSEVHAAYRDKFARQNGEFLLNLVVHTVTTRFNGVNVAVFGKPRSIKHYNSVPTTSVVNFLNESFQSV
jgi:hypothetical protein